MSTNTPAEQKVGITNAIAAYFMWGLAPIYFKLIDSISADEIMVHRVIWSSLFLVIIILITGKSRQLLKAIITPKLLLRLTITASFLAVNWFLFIWAVNNDHLLDASLGYYINPLFSVALGMIFLGERLRKWQKFAVALAIAGVLLQLIALGSLPIISLALAGTFGIYGLLRKKIQVDSFIGLLIESLLMLPIAIIFWYFFINTQTSNLFNNTQELNLLLMAAGLVTTAPLLCFTAAAKRLTLTALGFFQYIGPSMMFVLATFYYQETFNMTKLLTFIFIWLALIVFSIDSIKAKREAKLTQ